MKTFVLAHEIARENLKRYIDSLPLDGKTKVEIKKVTSKRSDAQNRLYWKWVDIMAKELGYTKTEMHETLVQNLLIPEVKEVMGGKRITIWPSTTKMSVKDFMHYLIDVDYFASNELNITLPRPEDEWLMAMGERV